MPRLMFWLLVGVVGLVVGCDGGGPPRLLYTDDGQYLPPQVSPGLVAQPESPIPDVPVPVGFRLLQDRGHVDVSGGGRSVHHVYQGRGRQPDAVTFFRQNLPRRGWERTRRPFEEEDGSITLAYTNGQENLQIHVQQRYQRLTLTMWLDAADVARDW
ncbi:MAG: hypothetical protein WD009_03220 [Phycisphaeraceae bacterium]